MPTAVSKFYWHKGNSPIKIRRDDAKELKKNTLPTLKISGKEGGEAADGGHDVKNYNPSLTS